MDATACSSASSPPPSPRAPAGTTAIAGVDRIECEMNIAR
jgi:hypothetical protein